MKFCLVVLALALPLLAQEEGGEDLTAKFDSLKAAVEKKDVAAVKKLSLETSQAAKKAMAAPASNDDEKKRADYAKDVERYSEYALSAMAIQATEPNEIVDLTDELGQVNPKSEYLGPLFGKYANAASRSGHPEKLTALAEKVVKADPSNAEALLVVAQADLQRNRSAQAVASASQALQSLSKRKADAETEALMSQAHYLQGLAEGQQQHWPQANSALQAAMPGIKSDPTRMSGALFTLGLANYQLGKLTLNKAQIRQALNYFQQCAAIKGASQALCDQNVRAIQTELR